MKNLTNIDEKVDAVLQSWDAEVPQHPAADFAKGVHTKIAVMRQTQRRSTQMAIAASVLWAILNVAVMQGTLTGIKNSGTSGYESDDNFEVVYQEYFGSHDVYRF